MSENELRMVERQKRWEMENVQRGVEMYQAALRRLEEEKGAGALIETKPGVQMMTAVLPHLISAIEKLQEQAKEGLKPDGPQGRPSIWWWPILCLSSEKLAVITLRTALSSIGRNSFTSIARQIGTNVKLEREFEMLAAAERRRVKEGRLTQYEVELNERRQAEGLQLVEPVSVLQLMKDYCKEITPRTVRKWGRRVDELDTLDWPEDVRIALGGALLQALVEDGGGWFERREHKVITRGRIKTDVSLGLTPLAEEWVRRKRELDEVARPWLTPMLCPPLEWTPVDH